MEAIVKEDRKVWLPPKLVVYGDVHQLTAAPGHPDPPGKGTGTHDTPFGQQPNNWAS